VTEVQATQLLMDMQVLRMGLSVIIALLVFIYFSGRRRDG
jgi:hypothetical protein